MESMISIEAIGFGIDDEFLNIFENLVQFLLYDVLSILVRIYTWLLFVK